MSGNVLRICFNALKPSTPGIRISIMTSAGLRAAISRIASSALLASRHVWPSKLRKFSKALATDWSSSTTRMSAMCGFLRNGCRHREHNPGARSFRNLRVEAERAAVAFHNGFRVHQSKTDAVAFGRDERIEDAVADSGVNADAVVA